MGLKWGRGQATNFSIPAALTSFKSLFLCVFFLCFICLQDVRSTTVAFLLLRIPTLKIKAMSKKEVFEANLKSECDLWHLMVKEMWAGKKMADDHKVWHLVSVVKNALYMFNRDCICLPLC